MLYTDMLLINVDLTLSQRLHISHITCGTHIFCTILDAVSFELLETIQQEKTNTAGAFPWLITQTFHQISACSLNYFH